MAGYGIARANRRVHRLPVVWSLLALLIRVGHRRWPLPRATMVALAVAGAVHLAGGLLPSPERRGADLLRDLARSRGPQVRPGRPRLHLGRRHRRRLPGPRPRDRRRPGRARVPGDRWPCWSVGGSGRPTSCSSSSPPFASPTPTSAASTTPAGTSPSTSSAVSLAAIGCAALATAPRDAAGGRPGRRDQVAARCSPCGPLPDPVDVPPLAFDPLGGHVEQEVAVARRCRPRRPGGWPGGSPTPALNGRPEPSAPAPGRTSGRSRPGR